ncbi:MAG: hypothetical protein BroJett011_04420 [Chloroflexota bacterium]|nr:MAG: hypothetical protein BroJett011_04420 [Chloroflexota bacterium]
MSALTRTHPDLAREGAFLKSCISTLVVTLAGASERLSQLRQQETEMELLTQTTHVLLLRSVMASSGLIVPAGMQGKVFATYQDEESGETGWVVQFGPLMARVPLRGGQGTPVGGDGA